MQGEACPHLPMGISATTVRPNKPESATQEKVKYRPEIDGLRALAVTAVIINHFNKDLLPSGYLGVDIFFVVSGYVITSSLSRRESESFGDFLSSFYVRRIKRLVPALAVFVLVVSALTSVLIIEPRLALETGINSIFGFSNIFLFRQSTDYFAKSTELNPFMHTWSLGVEEQFYFLFPFLIWFSGFGRQANNAVRNLSLWISAFGIASVAGFVSFYQHNQPAAYFLMPTRLWEIATGCLLFLSLHKNTKLGRVLEGLPPLLVVAAITGVMFLPIGSAVPATISIVALSAILIACLKDDTATFKAFTNQTVVHVGLISYSLYLWHWGVLSISRWTIGIHWWSVTIQVAAMLGLAEVSYKWVEKPFRSQGLFKRKWQTLLGGGAIVLTSVASVHGFAEFSSKLSLADSPRGVQIYSEGSGFNHDQCGNSRHSTDIPTETVYVNCWIGSSAEQAQWKLGSATRVFAYGNSYNDQLTPAYKYIGSSDDRMVFNVYYSNGCLTSLKLSAGEKVTGHCSEFFSQYLDFFWKNSRVGDILLLSTSLGHFSEDHEFKMFVDDTPISHSAALNIYSAELLKLAQLVKKKERVLIVVSSIPILKGNPDICSQWYSHFNNVCDRDFLFDDVMSSNTLKASKELERAAYGQFRYADIYTPIETALRNASNPWEYYYDHSHLSRKGSLRAAATIRRLINFNIPAPSP